MRISLGVTKFVWPDGDPAIGRRVGELARTADEAGFDTLWAMDHFFQIPINGPDDDPMLEAYSLLSYVAGQTERQCSWRPLAHVGRGRPPWLRVAVLGGVG